MSSDRVVAHAEAARILQVSVRTVTRWVDAGRLAATRTAGGHRRIRLSDVEALAAHLAQLAEQLEDGDAREALTRRAIQRRH
jgi:excisionase family DNA binding protein